MQAESNRRSGGWQRTVLHLFLTLAVSILVLGCKTWRPSRISHDDAQAVDAHGKVVGPILHADTVTIPLVGLGVRDGLAALRLWHGHLVADGILYYGSSDCSGAPFIDARDVSGRSSPLTRLPRTAIGAPGRTVYVAVPYASSRTVRIGSFSLHEICYFTAVFGAFVTPIEVKVVPTQPLADLAARFTPPFRIRNGS